MDVDCDGMLSLETDVQRDFGTLVSPTTFVSHHCAGDPFPHTSTVPLDDYGAFTVHGELYAAPLSPSALAPAWHNDSERASTAGSSHSHSHSSSPATSFRSTPPAHSPHADKATVVAPDPFDVFGLADPLSLGGPPGAVSNPTAKRSSQHLDLALALDPHALALDDAERTGALDDDMFAAATAAAGGGRGAAGQQPFVAAQHQQPFADALASNDYASAGITAHHTHTQYAFVQPAQQPPPSLDFPAPAPAHHQQPVFYSPQPAAYPQQQQQQHQQSFHFVANSSQQHAHAQPYVPVQFTTLNGATYAVAVPVSSQTPQAIETPHGTYYFVPSSLPIQQQHQPSSIQAVSPPAEAVAAVAAVPPTPAAPSPEPSTTTTTTATTTQGTTTRSMAGGRPKRASLAAPLTSSSIVVPSGTHAAVQAATNAALAAANVASLSTQQKIRLPVGQGKKGSTKRHPPKKEQPKRFVCPHPGCGRPFSRNFNMMSHYKSHLGIREFDCPACPKKFSRRHDRARHCAAVHDLHVDREGDALSRDASEEARELADSGAADADFDYVHGSG